MRVNWKLVLIHLAFWVLYIIVWGLRDMAYAPTFLDTIDGNIIGSLVWSLGVYVNLYVLVPKLLLKRQIWMYVFALAIIIVMMGVISSIVFGEYYLNIDLSTSKYFGSVQGMVTTASDFLIVYGLSTCLYFINEWYAKERKIKDLENQNLKAELDLLKGQINPHFLFNALNSIHVLIRKDTVKAQETLEKFSDLLSHQLYDTNKGKITLEQEIQNLNNFIELQKIRHEDHVQVSWKFEGDVIGKLISPMLFLNFVENAFKHGETSGAESARIDILINVVDMNLEFSCTNSVVSKNSVEKNGLGIANVRRRLDLIYPDKHELLIERKENKFSVNLVLNLDEN